MWQARSKMLPDSRGLQFTVLFDGRQVTYVEVITAWQQDASFRSSFNSWLAAVSYTGFRWETPGVTAETQSQPFEFVVLNEPGLARRPDPLAFAEHFSDAGANVAVFSNLGRNAIMVVPYPVAEPSAYGHLAAFVRLAPEQQRDALWKAVGDEMSRRIGTKPVWLSTAGAGVSWLHVRLDDRPKYYGFAPYRQHPV